VSPARVRELVIHTASLYIERTCPVLGVSLCLLLACSSNEGTGGGDSTATNTQTSVTGDPITTGGSQTLGSTTSTGTTGAATASASSGTLTASVTSAGGASSVTASSGGGGQAGQTFTLSSPAFEGVADCSATNPSVCDVFSDENISYMESPNNSPQLDWTGAPPGTQSFAVSLADVSYGQPLWTIWNIPADVRGLPANLQKDTAMPAVPAGAQQCNATFAEGDGYFGPESPCNVYQFVVYALAMPTFAPSQPEYAAVVLGELEALGDQLLGSATLSARTNYGAMCE